ncbi:MAG: SDR family NAD(P)-dependent oxidoreductase [Janthinobacterium lividum]
MANRLGGRVALVTGSGQGIGQATAALFARHGATVLFSDVNAERARQAAAGIAGADWIHLDVGDPAGIAAAFATIRQRHGGIDILVNNAGVGINASFLDFTLADFELTLKVNLTGAFLCAQAAARQMLTQREAGQTHRGKIINITSVSGQRGGMGRTAYGASKAGLDLLTRVMSTELAGRGINCNAIAPGPVATELAAAVHAAGGTLEAYHFLTPQHRYGEVEEIANAALFLASDESDYVNGHTLNVDGGFGAAGLMYPLPPPSTPGAKVEA